MLDAPALPPPAIVAPAPREVSFGLVSGRAPLGTKKIIVHVGRYVAAEEPLQGRSFSLHVRLTGGPTTIKVTAVDGRNRRSSRVVESVYGLPPKSDPRERAPRLDPVLGRTVRSLAARHGGTSGIYVQDLRTGRGAAWNAGARFPAASTLKLAIAVTVLRTLDRKPESFTQVSRLLGKMLVSSDNDAANALEVWLAGSTSAGSDRVNATMRALGPERLTHVRRLRDLPPAGGGDRADPGPDREPARIRRRQVHDRSRSGAAGSCCLSRRGREGAAAAVGCLGLGGAGTCSGCSRR